VVVVTSSDDGWYVADAKLFLEIGLTVVHSDLHRLHESNPCSYTQPSPNTNCDPSRSVLTLSVNIVVKPLTLKLQASPQTFSIRIYIPIL
jgi:hypothetical protein